MKQGIRWVANPRERAAASAFTLTELLVVLGVLTLLMMIRVGAAGFNQRASDRVVCANNLKQLGAAWQAYSDDQNGNLISNMGMGTAGPMPLSYRGLSWISGMFTSGNPVNAVNSDCTNTLYLSEGQNALIAPYTKSNYAIFKCPADKSTCQNGPILPRVRSYSLNGALGANGYAGDSNAKRLIMQYPGSGASTVDTFTYTKITSVKRPAEKFVVLDENPNSINDPLFFTDQSGAPNYDSGRHLAIDIPGSYHNLGCNFIFADGHYELREWRDSQMLNAQNINTSMPGSTDLIWLQSHAWEP